MNNRIEVYTDGCCLKNPGGAGGWACIIKHPSGTIDEHFGGFRSTTNNRMEIMAALAAVEMLCRHDGTITLYSDSQYLVNAMSKRWYVGWQRRGWMTAERTPVKNRDLWERMLSATCFLSIEFKWVRGHDGHPKNERCDYLAGIAARGASQDDSGYLPGV